MPAIFFLMVLLPSLSPHYGFYSDELYYIACARRPAFGYVDHPPLFVLLLRLHMEVFGDSLLALRALPAALGALTVYLAASMARRMGGGAFAQTLAALAVMMSPQFIIWFSFFSVNCLEVTLWTAATWIVVERCRSADPRLWLALGVIFGLSLLTKHTTVVLIGGVAIGTLMTSLRRDLLGPWPWLGGAAALLIVAPNVYWQIVNGWPSVEFYRRISEDNLSTSALGVLLYQVAAQNPASVVLWSAGAYYLLVSERGERFRPLGWIFVALLAVLMLGGQRRADRIAGIYPVVFAGGAVLLESVRVIDAGRLRRAWNTYTLPFFMMLIGLTAMTVVLPLLPPRLLTDHPLFDGTDDWRVQVAPQKLPYHLGNRTHWKDFVSQVAAVAAGLDADRRGDAIILADYFGHAGAIEYYGRDLPPVYSQHTGYYLWGPPQHAPQAVISIGIHEELLRESFNRVQLAGRFRCQWCPPWQDDLPIYVSLAPRRPFTDLWEELGRIGGMDHYRRRLQATRAADAG